LSDSSKLETEQAPLIQQRSDDAPENTSIHPFSKEEISFPAPVAEGTRLLIDISGHYGEVY
jgi:hypothetical protein